MPKQPKVKLNSPGFLSMVRTKKGDGEERREIILKLKNGDEMHIDMSCTDFKELQKSGNRIAINIAAFSAPTKDLNEAEE